MLIVVDNGGSGGGGGSGGDGFQTAFSLSGFECHIAHDIWYHMYSTQYSMIFLNRDEMWERTESLD